MLTQETSSALRAQLKDVETLVNLHADLSEVMCNPDGQIWIERSGVKEKTKYTMSYRAREGILRQLAGHHDQIVTRTSPALEAKLPFWHGGRFIGLLPPVVSAPMFVIRFPARVLITLEDMLLSGTITSRQWAALEEAVVDKTNIIVAGGTGSGKTTLVTALLQKIPEEERLVIIEDNPELQALSPNRVDVLTGDNYSLRDAVRSSLRMAPDRIIVGEIRDGGTALDLCKAWVTGHPGGIGTIHASSAEAVRMRLYTLMQEEVVKPSSDLINAATEMVVFIAKTKTADGERRRQVRAILTNQGVI